MDGCAGKPSVDRMVPPRKASGLVLRENVNKKDDKSTPFCSRIGCTTKITSTKGTRIGSTDSNSKVGRPPFWSSSNGKEIVGSSSRSPGGPACVGKPAKGTSRRQPSSILDIDSSETSSVNDGPTTAEPTLPRRKNKRGPINALSRSGVSGENIMTKEGNSSRETSRSSLQKSKVSTQDAPMGPSVSSSSGNSGHTVRGKQGLRNLRCNSGSDVLPSNSSFTKKINVTKKKNTDGESSSSSREKKSSRLVLNGRNQSSYHGSGITISDTRRNRILPTTRDNSVVSSSVRRTGYFGRSGRSGAVASSATALQTPQPATPVDPNASVSADVSYSPSNSYSRPNSSTGRLLSMIPGTPSEADPSRSLMNRDSFSRYNMNGIAEVLLALERIEQDEELTYEQLVSLETNLLSSGVLRFYDQHRDMRLDIDNMSYEELLALGDRMGTVSTALSEETLIRSLETSIYQTRDETSAISLKKDDDDDIKCSICQEEYVGGDEVGTLKCQHKYHVSCAQQWLRMKNWCPICKISAAKEEEEVTVEETETEAEESPRRTELL